MAFTSSPGVLILIAAAVAFVAHRLLFAGKQQHPLPPGPKGLPILGNIRDLPKGDILECHHWLKHKDLYGPISSITVLGQTFVVLNDSDTTLELLRDRATKHSGRPVMPFSGDMCVFCSFGGSRLGEMLTETNRIGWKHSLVTLQQTNDFRLQRKNLAKVAGSSVSLANLDRIQEEESAHFLLNVLNSPEDLFDHLRKEAGAVILKTTYGYTPEAHGKDPLVELATQTMTDFADVTTPGRYMVDVMPFCKWQHFLQHQDRLWSLTVTISKISPRLVSWHWLQGQSPNDGEAANPYGGPALRIRQARDAQGKAQTLVSFPGH